MLQRLAKNTSIFFISQIITYLLVFFYTIYIARYLGAYGFGILSFALAFSSVFFILADLGLNTLTVREVARDKNLAHKFLGNLLLVKIILSIATFGLIVLLVNLLGYPEEVVMVVYFISISIILTSIYGIFYSIFQAFEKMEYQSIGQIFNSILMFLGVLLVIYFNIGVIGFSLLYLITSIIILIYTLIICAYKFLIPKFEYDKEFWKITIVEALPFGLTGLSGMLYTHIDSVMLSIIQNNEVVGWYNAAYRIILFLIIIPGTINITIFPSMSKLHISSPESLRYVNEKYFKYMIIIAIPLAVAVTLLADKIILFIFGADYTQSIFPLQILIWTIVFTFAGAGFVRLLEATNKQFILTKISALCMVLNIALNLLLIPKYGLIGACVATVLTEIALVTGVIKMGYKFDYGIPFKKIIKDIIKITFASVLMGILIFYLKNINLLLLIISSSIFYLIILYLIKEIDNEDINLIRQIIN